MCKKFLLAAVNAKYIHSNPGVYSLRAFAKERLPEAEIQIAEYTINHQMDWILQDIYRKKPDFVGFSCYIWNISQVYELVRDLKQVLPETEIWLGGPEVSYDSGRILSQEPEIRGIMRGEGELTFSQVAEAYLAAEDRLAAEDPEDRLLARLEGILGITYRDGSGAVSYTHLDVYKRQDLVICNLLLKNMVARVRPCDLNPAVQLLIARPSDFSFPSGHTAAAFTSVFSLYRENNWLWKPVLVLAAVIAFSRMYLYVHFPTDILGGVAVGWVCALAGQAVSRRLFPQA